MLTHSINRAGNLILKEQDLPKNFCRNQISIGLTFIDGIPLSYGEVVFRNGDVTNTNFNRMEINRTIPDNLQVAILADSCIGADSFYNLKVDRFWGNHNLESFQRPIDWIGNSTTSLSLSAITRGDILVRKDGLTFGNLPKGHAKEAQLIAALESQGIRLVPDVVGKFSTSQPFH